MTCFPRCLYLVPGSLEWVWMSQLSCLTSMSRKLVAAFICLQKNGWENFSVCLGLYFWDSFLSWLWLPCIPELFTLCGSKAQTTLETIHNRLEKSYPTNTAVSLCSSPLGTFKHPEERGEMVVITGCSLHVPWIIIEASLTDSYSVRILVFRLCSV